MITQHVKPPIVITVPAPPRRRRMLPRVAQVLGILTLPALWALLSSVPYSDGAAVLAAFGCAGIIASVYRPTRVATTSRVYTVWGMYLRGDEETDKYFDEGR